MNIRGRTLTDRDVAFCFEQLGAGVKSVHLAWYVYGITRGALRARLKLAKSRGVTSPHHGLDPVSDGWTPAPPPPPPPTGAEAALEYLTTRGGLTQRDIAAGVGVSEHWAGVLLRRLYGRGAVLRRLRRRGGCYVYDAATGTAT